MIRKANIDDVNSIQKLINYYAKKDIMLAKSLNQLYENLRDFFVYVGDDGSIIGCCALHITWSALGEIKSLAVDEKFHNKGVGSELIEAAVKEAKSLGLRELFALTYAEKFFNKHNFVRVDKSKLPHKVWGECIECVKFPNCDEIPVMRIL